MKKLIFLLAIVIGAIQSLFAADPMVTQIRVLYASFNKLSLSGGIQVELINGKQYLEVKTFERYQDDIETYVKEGTLIVRWAPNRQPRVIWGGDVMVRIAVPTLHRIAVSGGGRVDVDGFRLSDGARLSISGGGRIAGNFNGEDMALSVSGGGRIDGGIVAEDITMAVSGGGRIGASVKCEDLNLSVSGGGRLELNGTCQQVSASVSGGGRIACRELIARDVVANASGGGSGEFTATGSTRSSKSGGGSVTIHRAN